MLKGGSMMVYKSDLLDKRIKTIKTNRGGKYTIHSPGQRIVYFVLNLNKRKKTAPNTAIIKGMRKKE